MLYCETILRVKSARDFRLSGHPDYEPLITQKTKPRLVMEESLQILL